MHEIMMEEFKILVDEMRLIRSEIHQLRGELSSDMKDLDRRQEKLEIKLYSVCAAMSVIISLAVSFLKNHIQ